MSMPPSNPTDQRRGFSRATVDAASLFDQLAQLLPVSVGEALAATAKASAI